MRGTDPTKSKWVCLKFLHLCKNYFTICIINEEVFYYLFVVLDRINSIFNPFYVWYKNILRIYM